MDDSPTCTAPECQNPSARGGICWAHLKRKQRKGRSGGRLRPYGRDGWERLNEAIHAYSDAEADAKFDQAAEDLVTEALRYTGMSSTAALEEARRRVRRCVHQFAREIKAAVESADEDPERRHA